jgi:NADPH:quinone reductase-like Zn-dependent oxidoreductase
MRAVVVEQWGGPETLVEREVARPEPGLNEVLVRVHAAGVNPGMPLFPRQAGAYAEYVVAPARHLAPKPANLTHVQAAALPLAGLTAWQALVDTADVRAGERVLVHTAAGGVGHLRLAAPTSSAPPAPASTTCCGNWARTR